ncbi:hypothetical protein Tco_0269547 [Tanacetum coccineum]
MIAERLTTQLRNSDACYHDPEKYEHAGPKVTTSHGGNTTTRMIKRFTVADDLKKGFKDHTSLRNKAQGPLQMMYNRIQ